MRTVHRVDPFYCRFAVVVSVVYFGVQRCRGDAGRISDELSQCNNIESTVPGSADGVVFFDPFCHVNAVCEAVGNAVCLE